MVTGMMESLCLENSMGKHYSAWDTCYYYPVDISTTVFSYSRAVQYHTILHDAGVIARALGLCGILATTMCFN